MQQDYRFVCCLLSVWNLSDTEQTTQTEGVSTTGWRGKYFGTRRRKETEIRESCTGSFSASFVMLEKLLVWSRRSGWSHRCDMWSAYWKEKCIPGLDGSTWGKDSIYVHKYIHIHPHSTYIHTSTVAPTFAAGRISYESTDKWYSQTCLTRRWTIRFFLVVPSASN